MKRCDPNLFPMKKPCANTHIISYNLGKTMPFLPAMTGNGNHTTYKNGDLG
jgi:hypothetical protein